MKRNEFRLALFTSFGFFFIWVDVCIGHLGSDQFKVFMLIPLVFLPFATVMTIVTALWPTKLTRNIFWGISVLAVIVGMVGFYFHSVKLQEHFVGLMQWQVLVRLMRYPPLFAPLAISGLGILGLMINCES